MLLNYNKIIFKNIFIIQLRDLKFKNYIEPPKNLSRPYFYHPIYDKLFDRLMLDLVGMGDRDGVASLERQIDGDVVDIVKHLHGDKGMGVLSNGVAH